jgi:hypothetical protein
MGMIWGEILGRFLGGYGEKSWESMEGGEEGMEYVYVYVYVYVYSK